MELLYLYIIDVTSLHFYFRLQYRMIFSIIYLTISHPVIKTYLTSWRVLACIQCMLACIHRLETWMRPFKSTYFVSVYHLGILRVAYIFSRENINIYNTSLVWTFIQFVCAVSFSIEIWIESQPYCSTYHVKIGYLSVSITSCDCHLVCL